MCFRQSITSQGKYYFVTNTFLSTLQLREDSNTVYLLHTHFSRGVKTTFQLQNRYMNKIYSDVDTLILTEKKTETMKKHCHQCDYPISAVRCFTIYERLLIPFLITATIPRTSEAQIMSCRSTRTIRFSRPWFSQSKSCTRARNSSGYRLSSMWKERNNSTFP